MITAPDLYRSLVGPWKDNEYCLQMQAARRIVTNRWRKGRIKPDQLLTRPRSWATLDYTTVENPNVRAELTWEVTQAATAHGLGVWFDAMLAEGISFSNAPGAPKLVYGTTFFPWTKPVPLAVGDIVTVTLRADLVSGEYIWGWDSRVLAQGVEIKANFKQSTFFGRPRSLAQLRKRGADYLPTLNEEGQIDRFILTLMDGHHLLGDIARQVAAQFPVRFTVQDALTRVRRLSNKYSQ